MISIYDIPEDVINIILLKCYGYGYDCNPPTPSILGPVDDNTDNNLLRLQIKMDILSLRLTCKTFNKLIDIKTIPFILNQINNRRNELHLQSTKQNLDKDFFSEKMEAFVLKPKQDCSLCKSCCFNFPCIGEITFEKKRIKGNDEDDIYNEDDYDIDSDEDDEDEDDEDVKYTLAKVIKKLYCFQCFLDKNFVDNLNSHMVYIYAINYKFLRIMSGMGGLSYST
jgi:hypothetical protein